MSKYSELLLCINKIAFYIVQFLLWTIINAGRVHEPGTCICIVNVSAFSLAVYTFFQKNLGTPVM